MKLKDMLSEILPTVETYAPSIGSLLGGPIGYGGGIALSLLGKTFVPGASNLSGLLEAIKNDPNAQDKLKSLEAEHGGWLKSFDAQFKPPSHVEITIKLDWDTQA